MFKLIDDIKQFHKFLSVQATLIGGAIVTYAVNDPTGASAAIGSILPPKYVPFAAVIVSVVITLAGRAIDQPKLNKGKDDANQ